MVRYSDGPFEPLEVRLGSREAFEAHQKSEAERTARVLAQRRKIRRESWLLLLKVVLILAAACAAIYLAASAAAVKT